MQNTKDLNPKNLFTIGAEVEVTSDSDGFGYSWYRAKVIKPPNPTDQSNEHFLIQYDNLVEEDDHSQLLKEKVHASFIRPLPPNNVYKPNKSFFELNDVVEAFHEDGWWVGVVKEVKEQNKYLVAFASQDEIFFRKRKLRIHLDWIDGKWINPRTKDSVLDNGSASSTVKKKRGRPSKIEGISETKGDVTHEAKDKENGSHANSNKKRDRPAKKDLQSVNLLKTVEGNENTRKKYKNKGKPEHAIQIQWVTSPKEDNEAEVPQNETSTELEGVNAYDPLQVKPTSSALSAPISISDQSWPFIKTSRMWKTIDSLDIFKNMSIMPHFSPLHKFDSNIREKLAIDMMIKYAYEAERILKLSPSKLNDSNTILDIMDSLKDLEPHGFDTMALEEYLGKLSPGVHKERELRQKLQKVEIRILKCQEERNAAEMEMIQFVEQMKSVKKIKDEELARLEAEKCVISNEIQSLELICPKSV